MEKPETADTREYPIRVKTPLGDLVAYPSVDPHNPGIFIGLDRGGAMLSLSGTECRLPAGGLPGGAAIVTRVWGDAMREDPTTDERHIRLNAWEKLSAEEAGTERAGP